MSLETTTNIAGLQSNAPSASDPVNQGDDHIRMIKAVLKNIFPGSGGQGFSIPITSTEADINLLTGLAASGGLIPTGTKMAFYQSTPPSGWSAVAIQNDSMMRVVTSGTSGGTSGAGAGHSPILNNVVPSHTHTVTINSANTDHTHAMNADGRNVLKKYGVGAPDYNYTSATDSAQTGNYSSSQNTGAMSANSSHTHTASTNGGSSSTNWEPRYMNFCIGQKS